MLKRASRLAQLVTGKLLASRLKEVAAINALTLPFTTTKSSRCSINFNNLVCSMV
jgi:hypothetical protein